MAAFQDLPAELMLMILQYNYDPKLDELELSRNATNATRAWADHAIELTRRTDLLDDDKSFLKPFMTQAALCRNYRTGVALYLRHATNHHLCPTYETAEELSSDLPRLEAEGVDSITVVLYNHDDGNSLRNWGLGASDWAPVPILPDSVKSVNVIGALPTSKDVRDQDLSQDSATAALREFWLHFGKKIHVRSPGSERTLPRQIW